MAIVGLPTQRENVSSSVSLSISTCAARPHWRAHRFWSVQGHAQFPRAASQQEADCVYHGADQEDPAPMAASRQLGRTFTHEDQFSKAEGLGVPATPPQFSCP